MAESSFEQEVERNFRWNFAVNTIDLSFIMFGISLISRETVIPLLVSRLTSSTIVIGLVPAVYLLGIYLPQLIGAGFTETMPRKKPIVAVIGALGERLPYLLVGLVVLFLAVPSPLLAVGALVILYGISGASAGFATPAWFDMIAKVIPVRRRGLFTGVSHGVGALMGVAGAALIGVVLERWPFPLNFGLLFVFGFASMMISWVGLVLNREPASPNVHPSTPLRVYLRRLPIILRSDRNFARYIASVGVIRAGTMAGGFVLVYGVQRFQLSGTDVGLMTGVLIGCQAVLNPVWGLIGDRFGHKTVLVGGACALALTAATAALATSSIGLILAFIFMGAFISADSTSMLTIIPEFCRDEDRPTYIGLTNTLLAPATALAPLLGGYLAAQIGYQPMFGLAGFVAALGAGCLAILVREPRHVRFVGHLESEQAAA